MKIVLFTHPTFLGHQSMPRYANMLKNGMQERGHEVIVWTAKARFYNLPFIKLKKWLGYIDQYIVFPIEVFFRLLKYPKDTLFVFADQALGPWMPLVKNKRHVVHCHDFLALKSALGVIPENPTSFTGKMYQNYIRKGFSNGKHFISISKKTQQDLHELHQGKIVSSTVCYNGLNRNFKVLVPIDSRSLLEAELNISLSSGYILHIGGNQYYKNRKGVVEIYDSWRKINSKMIPLILIGEKPPDELLDLQQQSIFKDDIHFITNLSDKHINIAYSGASCLLFPSLDEGFGWPIVEAMASGCPVITNNKSPMNEVGGSAALYIEKRPSDTLYMKNWLNESASVLEKVMSLNTAQRIEVIENSLKHSQKFTAEHSLDAIEVVYKKISQTV